MTSAQRNLRNRLVVMNFLQFAVWGAWLISLGGYMMQKLGFSGLQVGSIYATMGIASVFMPAIVGIIADRWINAERLLGILHFLGVIIMISLAQVTTYEAMYPLMLLLCMTYMPTLGLTNTIAYSGLNKEGMDIVKDFPPIRVWGTVGFILAMWLVDITHSGRTEMQLYISATFGLLLAIYSFTLPKCPPTKLEKGQKRSLVSQLGLDAFVLFKQPIMATFFLFAMLLGACLQVTNTFGNPFLDSFSADYADSIAVKYPNVLLSLSQISETLFILAIPFFLRKFGIKNVMIMSMLAWVLRYGFFGIGNPAGGFIFLILSMVVYGMAFDFFNISGSIFVDQSVSPSIRASAQGLFLLMTNGLGAIIGGYASGKVVDLYTETLATGETIIHWQPVWFIFASYALVLAIAFAICFRYKPQKETTEVVH